MLRDFIMYTKRNLKVQHYVEQVRIGFFPAEDIVEPPTSGGFLAPFDHSTGNAHSWDTYVRSLTYSFR